MHYTLSFLNIFIVMFACVIFLRSCRAGCSPFCVCVLGEMEREPAPNSTCGPICRSFAIQYQMAISIPKTRWYIIEGAHQMGPTVWIVFVLYKILLLAIRPSVSLLMPLGYRLPLFLYCSVREKKKKKNKIKIQMSCHLCRNRFSEQIEPST